MKKWIIIGAIILVVFIAYSSIKGSYNNLVINDQAVKAQWGTVESAYQRRSDLIPNLVNTVKGYADFEKTTLTQVIEARAKATQVTIKPENLNAASMQQFQAAQGQLSGALSRLLMTVEQYPNLKANEGFLNLQAQLEGTENRIAVERKKFNDLAQVYNTNIHAFPQLIFAKLFGFTDRDYFQADQGAQNAPKVNF